MNARQYALAVGANLRRVRKDRGWSLMDVESKSGGAWKAVVVGSYERGDRSITVSRLYELVSWYGCSVAEILPADETQPTVEQLLRRALATASGVDIADVVIRPAGTAAAIKFLREPQECNCQYREANGDRAVHERVHAGNCGWWPDATYTLARVAEMLQDRFGGES